ncbi:MAG: CehA/McbA family metallohydrolase [Chloroflexi bacterium]|nr:CehA/McbA family metallohydrolase [Chloroflexota bacterium]
MTDYEPVDLSVWCNAGAALLGADTPLGLQVFHGLPFQIGASRPAPSSPCVIHFGSAGCPDPLRIAIGRPAHRVIVAHRLLESTLYEGGSLGEVVAEYVFHLAGGERVVAPTRERFEILALSVPWGGHAFNAVPDRANELQPRYEGRWDDYGRRQTEVSQAVPHRYVLWTWTNPRPAQAVVDLEIVPKGPSFLIAAVTLGHLDEHPFNRAGARPVKIVLPDASDAAQPFDLTVEVDRGAATYPYALPLADADAFLADGHAGYGEAQNSAASPAYVEIAGTPSATVTVKQGEQVLGQARWGDLEATGVATPSPRLRLEVVDPGRNWVHTTIVDDATGRPVPCRVHFRSPEGVPYQPHGHHGHVNSNLGTWHADVGGDVRLGQMTYAYTDGNCQGWLPRGEVIVDVARGFEYTPLRTRVTIAPGQQRLELHLKRFRDMAAERWFSGDTHVHFLSTQGSFYEARGEDLGVVNLLLSQWGNLFTNTEEFTGRPVTSPDGATIVYATQENRQHFLGHLTLLGVKEPIMPWCTDGPSEAEMGGTLDATMSDWADRCHAQGGTVVIPHVPMPNGEPAALIATGRADAVEMIREGSFNYLEYYRYLNGGYRLPLVGGTDKMSSDVPVGLYRTYVYIPPDEPFDYDSWCRNLRLGRTFHSGGPLLDFSVEGARIGDTVPLPAGGGTVEVMARAQSVIPIHRLEIVQQGRVVASTEDAAGARELRLTARVAVDGHTWLAARARGPEVAQVHHHDGWQRGVFAHTSPIYVACGSDWQMHSPATSQYMLTLIEGTLTYIRQHSPQYRPGTVTHHHGESDHQAYLERPFHQAREAIHRRLHDLGLPH